MNNRKEYDPHSGAYFDPKSSGKATPGYAQKAFKIIDAVVTKKLTVIEALADLERIKDGIEGPNDVSRETTDTRTCCRCKVMVTEDEGQFCITCQETWDELT